MPVALPVSAWIEIWIKKQKENQIFVSHSP